MSHKTFLLSLFLFCFHSLSPHPLLVSLGSHCEPALRMREQGLREQAFPFDWLITPHEGLLLALEEDFAHFPDPSAFFTDPAYPQRLEHRRYRLEFRHHWPFPDDYLDEERLKCWIEEILAIQEKRIARFRKLKEANEPLIFVRSAQDSAYGGTNYWWTEADDSITEAQAEEIYSALARYFPGLDFSLAIINHIAPDPPLQSSDRIRYFYVSKATRDFTPVFNSLIKGSPLTHP